MYITWQLQQKNKSLSDLTLYPVIIIPYTILLHRTLYSTCDVVVSEKIVSGIICGRSIAESGDVMLAANVRGVTANVCSGVR